MNLFSKNITKEGYKKNLASLFFLLEILVVYFFSIKVIGSWSRIRSSPFPVTFYPWPMKIPNNFTIVTFLKDWLTRGWDFFYCWKKMTESICLIIGDSVESLLWELGVLCFTAKNFKLQLEKEEAKLFCKILILSTAL